MEGMRTVGNLATSSRAMGSLLARTLAGLEMKLVSHSSERRCVTPARSGPTRLPSPIEWHPAHALRYKVSPGGPVELDGFELIVRAVRQRGRPERRRIERPDRQHQAVEVAHRRIALPLSSKAVAQEQVVAVLAEKAATFAKPVANPLICSGLPVRNNQPGPAPKVLA